MAFRTGAVEKADSDGEWDREEEVETVANAIASIERHRQDHEGRPGRRGAKP